MNQIINSILNNDLYKISMMNYALELFPEATSVYKFKNRGSQRFNQEFMKELQKQINSLTDLKLTNEDYIYLKENFTYLTPGYLEYLKNFRYDTSKVSIGLTKDNDLSLEITGTWVEKVLFEVPLMSIISELYFSLIDINWNYDDKKKEHIIKLKN